MNLKEYYIPQAPERRPVSESDGQSQGKNNEYPARITSSVVRQILATIIIYWGPNESR